MIEINNIDGEIWRTIVGYEGYYQVSNFGRVKSLTRKNHVGRTYNTRLMGEIDLNGYKAVALCKLGCRKVWLIHRLVATHFIENANNLPDVNHLNCIKSDNKTSNLEWTTEKNNTRHAINNGKMDHIFGENNWISKLTLDDVKEIRKLYLTGKYSYEEIAKMFGVQKSNVRRIVINDYWHDKEYGKLIPDGIDTKTFKRNKGENNGASKLTRSQVETIRYRYKLGNISLSHLGRQFRVSQKCIGKVVRFESWK